MVTLMTGQGLILWFLVTLVGSFGGAWFGAYFKKKGENFATHEDIDKLVDQVKAVTTATKQIEAKISDEVWDRQKRWEVKRDALIDGVKKLSALVDGDEEARAYVGERAKEWNDAAVEFETATTVVGLVCRERVSKEMQQLVRLTRSISAASRLVGTLELSSHRSVS